MKIIYTLILSSASLMLWAKDPFISPFEPKVEIKKDEKKEDKTPNAKEAQAIEIEKKFQEIVTALQAENLTSAKTLLQILSSQDIPDVQKSKLEILQVELENYKKTQAQLHEYKNMITIQGKMILSGKKNILMLNGQPVSEGDTLSEVLKIESPVFLQEIQEEFYRIRLNNVSIKISY